MRRHQINKLIKGHSTKGERKFLEILKRNHIPFQSKVMIGGREIDFVVGNYAIEIDGHSQDSQKNWMLLENKYIPVHLCNWEITPQVEEWLKQIHGRKFTIGNSPDNR